MTLLEFENLKKNLKIAKIRVVEILKTILLSPTTMP